MKFLMRTIIGGFAFFGLLKFQDMYPTAGDIAVFILAVLWIIYLGSMIERKTR